MSNSEEIEMLGVQVAALTYVSKFTAGSWRFLTYFGRDTLISLRLFMVSFTPEMSYRSSCMLQCFSLHEHPHSWVSTLEWLRLLW